MAKIKKKKLGWREWIALPQLGIDAIKAKIDTGARTSALHAFDLKVVQQNGQRIARFKVHPFQKDLDKVVECEAPVIDERDVTDSGGHRERRLVIETEVIIGDIQRRIEVTLTDRDNMLFRMLLGRTAIKHDFIVDPGKSFLTKQSDDT